MDTKNKEENVLNFPNNDYALFSQNMKKSLSVRISKENDINEKLASETVNSLENALCNAIVKKTRQFFQKIGSASANLLFDD